MPLLKNNALVGDTWLILGNDDALPASRRRDRALRAAAARVRVSRQAIRASSAWSSPMSTAPRPLRHSCRDFPWWSCTSPPSTMAAPTRWRGSFGRFGYRGEIRATGNVLPDQLQFMLQVGFDAFEIGDRFPLQVWQAASKQMSLAYQRGLFRRSAESEIWTERHTDAEPWLEQPHAG